MISLERSIRFEEVDAAGIVFFAHFLGYAHEAMEHFFDGLDGGYCRLIVERKIGLPAVKVEVSFTSPVRYGERLRIETTTTHLGTRSATLRYRMLRAATGELCAEVAHTVVTTDLACMRSCAMPDDVRAVFAAHLAAP